MSLQVDDVGPPGGGILAPKVVLDGVGKDVGLALAVLLRILLTAEDDGLGAVDLVDAVDDGIQTFHLLEMLGIEVEEVELHGRIGSDAHQYDAGLLVVIALDVDVLERLRGGLHDVDGAVGGHGQTLLAEVPVLGQVLPEGIGIEEDGHDGGHGALLPQFLGTAGGVVGDVGLQGVDVGHHAVERAARADAFLLGQFLVGHAILAVQFLPGAVDDDVVEGGVDPRLGLLGKVVGGLHTQGLEAGAVPAADAPDLAYGKELEGLATLLFGVDEAAMAVAGVFLGEVTGRLCQGLCRGDAYADGYAHALPDAPVELFAPPFQSCAAIVHVERIEIDETFIDAVAEIGRCFLSDDFHHPGREFAIELVVAGEDGYLLVGQLLCQLVIGHPGLDAEFLGFVAACHDASIVVAQHNHGFAIQVRAKDSFARDIAVVAVNDAVHGVNVSNSLSSRRQRPRPRSCRSHRCGWAGIWGWPDAVRCIPRHDGRGRGT